MLCCWGWCRGSSTRFLLNLQPQPSQEGALERRLGSQAHVRDSGTRAGIDPGGACNESEWGQPVFLDLAGGVRKAAVDTQP